jgi:hypothetical protein
MKNLNRADSMWNSKFRFYGGDLEYKRTINDNLFMFLSGKWNFADNNNRLVQTILKRKEIFGTLYVPVYLITVYQLRTNEKALKHKRFGLILSNKNIIDNQLKRMLAIIFSDLFGGNISFNQPEQLV